MKSETITITLTEEEMNLLFIEQPTKEEIIETIHTLINNTRKQFGKTNIDDNKTERTITFVKECSVNISKKYSDEEVEQIIKGIVESEQPDALDYAWKDENVKAKLYGK